jgi:hypothetical protein
MNRHWVHGAAPLIDAIYPLHDLGCMGERLEIYVDGRFQTDMYFYDFPVDYAVVVEIFRN